MDKTLQEVGPNTKNVKVKSFKTGATQLKGPSVAVLTVSGAPRFVYHQHWHKYTMNLHNKTKQQKMLHMQLELLCGSYYQQIRYYAYNFAH